MQKRLNIAVALLSLSGVFAGFILLTGWRSADSAAPLLLFLLPPVIVFGGGLAAIFTLRQGVRDDLARINQELDEERRLRQEVQAQCEETIAKRIFELQVANGALNREIAERIQAEGEVRELQKQLQLILDSAGEGILGLDNKGRVVFINRAAALMLGWEPEELIGNTHHQLIHHHHADGTPHPEEECPIYMAYRDGLVHFRTGDVFWCKNGTSFPVEYVSTPIRDRGMLTGAVVVFRDMNTFL